MQGWRVGLAGSTMAVIFAVAGCNSIRSSSVQTGPGRYAPNAGAVTVKATQVPPGAVEIGAVQTYGSNKKLVDLVPAFAAEVAKVGGNWGKIDHIRTKFEIQRVSRQEQYQCGSLDHPRTCSRTVYQNIEVSTTTIVGRAFRVE